MTAQCPNNGKRTIARKYDVRLGYDDVTILEAFLTGKETIGTGHEQCALRDMLGRLSELLGPVGESDGLAPKYPEVSTEVDL